MGRNKILYSFENFVLNTGQRELRRVRGDCAAAPARSFTRSRFRDSRCIGDAA
jgi:hypothetical protein